MIKSLEQVDYNILFRKDLTAIELFELWPNNIIELAFVDSTNIYNLKCRWLGYAILPTRNSVVADN